MPFPIVCFFLCTFAASFVKCLEHTKKIDVESMNKCNFSLGCATSLTGVPGGTQIGTHEVRPAKTSNGFAFYFDKVGNAYIWGEIGNTKGMLVLQKPNSKASPSRVASHGDKQWYLQLTRPIDKEQGKIINAHLLVHRGVAMAFPEICGLPDLFRNQIDHINGDKHDNRVCNLRWVSNSENVKASYAARRAKDI